MFKGSVGGQNGVVRLHNGGGYLRCWVDGEFQFGFLSVIYGQPFHQQRGETGSGTTTEGVEDEETLQSSTLVGQFTDPVQNQVDDFFTDGVVTSGVVVSGIFFAGDELFRVEKLPVCAGSDFVDYSGFQVYKHGPGYVLTRSGFAEESVERIVTSSDGFVGRHLTVRLDAMFKAVQLPTGVTNLDTGLANVD